VTPNGETMAGRITHLGRAVNAFVPTDLREGENGEETGQAGKDDNKM
jgi:hypothetical protein